VCMAQGEGCGFAYLQLANQGDVRLDGPGAAKIAQTLPRVLRATPRKDLSGARGRVGRRAGRLGVPI
jgi:hypothetical protein